MSWVASGHSGAQVEGWRIAQLPPHPSGKGRPLTFFQCAHQQTDGGVQHEQGVEHEQGCWHNNHGNGNLQAGVERT